MTFVPRFSRNWDSNSLISAVFGLFFLPLAGLTPDNFRTNSSVCLTVNSFLKMVLKAASLAFLFVNPSRALPCPSEIFPVEIAFRMISGRFSNRNVFATAVRLFPTRCAIPSCERLNSSFNFRYAFQMKKDRSAGHPNRGFVSSTWTVLDSKP